MKAWQLVFLRLYVSPGWFWGAAIDDVGRYAEGSLLLWSPFGTPAEIIMTSLSFLLQTLVR